MNGSGWIEWAAYLRKGLIAVAGGLSQLGVALAPASDGGASITPMEWVQVAMAALTAAGVLIVGNAGRPSTVTVVPPLEDAQGRHEA